MEKFVDQVITSGAYEPLDRICVLNKTRGFIGGEGVEAKGDESVVSQLADLAAKCNKIGDGQTAREILNNQSHDLMAPALSVVNHKFWGEYQQPPLSVTDWFYNLCTSNDYVKVVAIEENVVSDRLTRYGNLGITTSLSKPGKDPKVIAAVIHDITKEYP